MLPGVERWGLSPRVRGNRSVPCGGPSMYGSIPACAGEPPLDRSSAANGRVYPRVCGGTDTPALHRSSFPGLSPRVRGNPERAHPGLGGEGSIPACAGEPRTRTVSATRARVYPRVCGGTTGTSNSVSPSRGLSPRVRGNPHRAGRRRRRDRSIPACAGEPHEAGAVLAAHGVYPRVCGGTDTQTAAGSILQGLSPRVRGNRRARSSVCVHGRSIPACAGEPRTLTSQGQHFWVYPRVCGGTCLTPSHAAPFGGLSPRVRGNLGMEIEAGRPAGSIPACAGEPRGTGARRAGRRVYPRVCGGTAAGGNLT